MELITAVWIFLIGATFGAILCFAIAYSIPDGKPKRKDILKNAPYGATHYVIGDYNQIGYYVNGKLTYSGHGFSGWKEEDKKPIPRKRFN